MRALIVESDKQRGLDWQHYLRGLDVDTTLATSGSQALTLIETRVFDVIVLNLVLAEGGALAVADLAFFRQPDANVVFVTDTTFFSDGSIFRHSANARAFIEARTPPEDVAAIVHHYGSKRPAHAARQDQFAD